jgi:hypothetical protein
MRRVLQPVRVTTKKGYPVRIEWDGRRQPVTQVGDMWVRQGRWWGDEERRIHFRVETPSGAFELYRSGDSWVVTRVCD